MKAGNDSLHIDSSHVPFKFSRRRQCRIHIKIHPNHCYHIVIRKQSTATCCFGYKSPQIKWTCNCHVLLKKMFQIGEHQQTDVTKSYIPAKVGSIV